MLTKIKSLLLDGDIVLPRTVAKAVIMEDGKTLAASIKDIPADDIKIVGDLAITLGVVEGTTLAEYLTSISSKSTVVATAEVIPADIV